MADEASGLAAVESLLGDRYTREARLAPAFLSLFPILLLMMAWIGDIQRIIPGLLTLLCFFGVVRWIAHISRGLGDSKEISLFRSWGGKPTTTLLRSNPRQSPAGELDLLQRFIPDQTQRHAIELRYKSLFRKPLPIARDEKATAKKLHPSDALDNLYEPIVSWLRESTRGNKLVFEENISYGFQRNFFALKEFALLCCLSALAIHGGAVWITRHQLAHQPWGVLIAVPLALLAYLFCILRFVSEDSVKLQGFAYAHQLLNSVYATPPEVRTRARSHRAKAQPFAQLVQAAQAAIQPAAQPASAPSPIQRGPQLPPKLPPASEAGPPMPPKHRENGSIMA